MATPMTSGDGLQDLTYDELLRECRNKQRVINHLNEIIDGKPSSAVAATDDKTARHLTAEHHAIQAQELDSPLNACCYKETCLWLKRIALAAPSVEYRLSKSEEAASRPAECATTPSPAVAETIQPHRTDTPLTWARMRAASWFTPDVLVVPADFAAELETSLAAALKETPQSTVAAPNLPDPGEVWVELGLGHDVQPRQVEDVMRAATKLFRRKWKQQSSIAATEPGPHGFDPKNCPTYYDGCNCDLPVTTDGHVYKDGGGELRLAVRWSDGTAIDRPLADVAELVVRSDSKPQSATRESSGG